MKNTCRSIIVLLVVILTTIPVYICAQQSAVSAEIPSGWVKFDVAERSFISRSADQNWITASISNKPASQPATSELDLVAQLDKKGDLLLAKILKDSSTLSPTQVEQYIDKTLRPKLVDLVKIKPTIVYYVLTDESIKQALLSGWRNDFFKYDQDRDQLDYSHAIKLENRQDGRDLIIPATFNGADSEQQRKEQLSRYIQSVENAVKSSKNTRQTATFIVLTSDFLKRESFKEFSNETDQQWFVTGLTHVLAVRYLSDLTGVPGRTLIEAVIAGQLPDGVRSSGQNLLQPLDEKAIKEEFLPAYREARRRKAISVVFNWYEKAGQEKLSETLLAINRLKPLDGPTLVKIIKDVTGEDLTDPLSK